MDFICFGIITVLVTTISFVNYQPAPPRPFTSESKLKFVRPTHAVMILVYLTLPAMLAFLNLKGLSGNKRG